MTIILFLIDNSASMNQRTYLGTTYLDTAKSAVDHFMKARGRDPQARWDRYMLLTFEDPPYNVKAGWKENSNTFMNELKLLEANDLTTMGSALKNAFDILNINRATSNVEGYGSGRFPFCLEPAMIICISDGRSITSQSGASNELVLPMNSAVPGSELTSEPFRWDQRLYAVCLRLPALPPPDVSQTNTYIPLADDSPIEAMCDVTGGRSYSISSHRMLQQCMESLVTKVQSGVVIHFKKTGPDPPPVGDDVSALNGQWSNCRKMIHVQRSAQKGGYVQGTWPIPEPYWPDISAQQLPPRTAQPILNFTCTPCELVSSDILQYDRYEIEPSPLTQFILSRKQPNVAWPVTVTGSAKFSETNHPFGYIKPSTNLQSVYLFVLPYNYATLFPLIDEAIKIHKTKVTPTWRMQFENYLKGMPLYYGMPLRKELKRIGLNLLPESMDVHNSYSVMAYLKKIRNQAKLEYDKLVSSVSQRPPNSEFIPVSPRFPISIVSRDDFDVILKQYGSDIGIMQQQLQAYETFSLPVNNSTFQLQLYRNPFDISRNDLLKQLLKMKENFLRPSQEIKSQDEDSIHSIPVSKMGDYHSYLENLPTPLRPLETTPSRIHTFGNPFKVSKNFQMIDEADEAMPGNQRIKKKEVVAKEPVNINSKRRKRGPIPKDFPIKKPYVSYNGYTSDLYEDLSSISSDSDSDAMEEINISQPPSPKQNGLVTNGAFHNVSMSINDRRLSRSDSINVDEDEDNSEMNAMKEIDNFNTKLKLEIFKEVRRPGKDYSRIFEKLEKIRGDTELRCLLVQAVIHEANRFRRIRMVSILQMYYEALEDQKKRFKDVEIIDVKKKNCNNNNNNNINSIIDK